MSLKGNFYDIQRKLKIKKNMNNFLYIMSIFGCSNVGKGWICRSILRGHIRLCGGQICDQGILVSIGVAFQVLCYITKPFRSRLLFYKHFLFMIFNTLSF